MLYNIINLLCSPINWALLFHLEQSDLPIVTCAVHTNMKISTFTYMQRLTHVCLCFLVIKLNWNIVMLCTRQKSLNSPTLNMSYGSVTSLMLSCSECEVLSKLSVIDIGFVFNFDIFFLNICVGRAQMQFLVTL